MLNIEVIKFEAQDVITGSGVVKPVAPAPQCNCDKYGPCDTTTSPGLHLYKDAAGNLTYCPGIDGKHTH